MTNPELKYREATNADQTVIVKFQLAMAEETERLKLDPATCRKGVAAVFEQEGLGTYYIAQIEERVVGCLLITTEWSDWRNGQVWWIQSLYLEPALRGKGVYSAFYAFIRDLAKATPNVRGLRLYVDRTNAHARAVYRKLGMSADHYELFESLF